MAARSCPGSSRAATSPCRTCSRRSASTRSARCRDEDLEELERVACPSAGSCGGQFTANTMACVSEAIGLALPGSAGTPAPYEARDKWAEASGEAVMSLLAQRHPPARHRHPAEPRERGPRRRRLGRLDQRRAAPAGDRARVRDRVRPARRGRDLPRHALHRRPQAGRPLRHEGSGRGRRRAAADEGAARRRLPARRLHHGDRQDHRREPGRRALEPRPGRGPPASPSRSPAGAASSACAARWRPRARS